MKNVKTGLYSLDGNYVHLGNVGDFLPFITILFSNICLQLWTATHDIK